MVGKMAVELGFEEADWMASWKGKLSAAVTVSAMVVVWDATEVAPSEIYSVVKKVVRQVVWTAV
jgi:hypothetical protein